MEKEKPTIIKFSEIEVSHWKSNHLDADIHEDGTSSLPGIGKKPKE